MLDKDKNLGTFSDGIKQALEQALADDDRVLCFGLGINDPKGIFGTTKGLSKQFGEDRVFDVPAAENGMTGVAIGAALGGHRVVITHQRLDFAILSMDQIVNGAAKWRYMFGGQFRVPIVIRLIIGRGWGQGPTHAQNLHSWFAHVPGLKVVCPTTPWDAKNLLYASIMDNNPVIFLEHRWLHNSKGELPIRCVEVDIGKSQTIAHGKDLTILSSFYMTAEARAAINELTELNVSAELIDLISLNPIDWKTITASVKKTGRLLVLDTANITGSLSGELIARITTDCFDRLLAAPKRLALPDIPEPTSYGLTENYYPTKNEIIDAALMILERPNHLNREKQRKTHHDIPGEWFSGPF